MELTRYVAMARRWLWTLIIAGWVAGLAGYFVASQIPPTYESRSRVLIGPINADAETLRAASLHVQTYGELIASQPLLEGTIEQLGLSIEPRQLRPTVRATADTTTRLLTITAEHGDPELAAAIANALFDQLELITSQSLSRPDGAPLLLEPAEVPSSPVAPQISLIVGLAVFAGLLGAIVLLLLIEYFSDAVMESYDLAQAAPVPLLGTADLSRPRRLRSANPLIVEAAPDSRAAIAYRLITTKLAFAAGDHSKERLLVVGAQTHDGSGEVAANLAAAFARSGKRVALVDANAERREITRLLRLDGRVGLTDLLAGGPDVLDDALHHQAPDVVVLPYGLSRHADLVDAGHARQILDLVAARADLIIVNSAPIHLSASTLMWAGIVDSTVLTAHRGESKRHNVVYAVDSLRLVGANLVGTILQDGRQALRKSDARAGSRRPAGAQMRPDLGAPVAVRQAASATRSAAASGRGIDEQRRDAVSGGRLPDNRPAE
ncbi:MAG: hypothetical protein ACRDGV_00795 [Candidatus Limnocylindria bacterium]